MSRQPRVSVVMPMYNVEKYVLDAVQSVLNQTFEDFELLAVDDGSPDESASIVRAINDSRVRVLTKPNGGLSSARNFGIAHARGKYIAFLDADDAWLPSKLQSHVEHLDRSPKVGVSYSGSRFMDEAGVPLNLYQKPKLKRVSARDLFLMNPIGNGSAPVIRKEIFEAVKREDSDHHYFDEGLRQSEDVEMWLRIALMSDWQFAGVKGALTLYRVNHAGLSANVEAQFQAWRKAMRNNCQINPAFVERYEKIACAYQYRYLARRAVYSRDWRRALKYVASSIASAPSITWLSPIKTLTTCAGVLYALLSPRSELVG